MSHEAICPCNLQCNLCRKKYCRLQLGCQTLRNLFCDLQWDYILHPPSILKCQRHSDYVVLWLVPSQTIARQVAVGVSHAATCCVAFRKVEAASTFSATCNAIFRCETSCKHGVSHEEVFLATCNVTPLRCKLQGKLPRVTWPLFFSSRKYFQMSFKIKGNKNIFPQ